MKKPPVVATAILMCLGPREEPIVGDLLEEYGAGRSRRWFWWQVLSAVAVSVIREIRHHPVLTLRAIATGWAILALLFVLFGDAAADGLAKLLWNWDRQMAYGGSQEWWPFQICTAVVSYAGFAISAWAVARLHGRKPQLLLAYVTTVVAALTVSAVLLEILIRRAGSVPVPHPLFYFVSVTLPYQWRSGFLMVPFITLLSGLAAGRRAACRPA